MRPPLSVLLSKVYWFVSWDPRYISFKLVDDAACFVLYISLLWIKAYLNKTRERGFGEGEGVARGS